MGESLIKQVTWMENTVELTRQELREVSQKGDYSEITRIADRLADELKALSSLRERAAALAGRDLAKQVAAQLMRMAKADRQGARAIAAHSVTEPQSQETEADHAARFN